MKITVRNRLWLNMAPDQREKCLREVLKLKFSPEDQDFYGTAEHMASLVATDDTSGLPLGFGDGIKSWMRANFPAETIAALELSELYATNRRFERLVPGASLGCLDDTEIR
ncbi:MAG TPA: hypothetical protein VJB98_00920 [Candidatus Paceibacterota bacterium]